MNIGITLSNTQIEKIWSNGIVQNVLNLYFLLKNIPEFNVFLVDPVFNENKNLDLEDNIFLKQLDDLVDDLNLILIIGVEIKDEHYNKLKKNGCKIIHYNCGSNYMINMEMVLFDIDKKINNIYKHTPDEIWIIPQNYETNKYYFETIYKKPSKSIPFIWSSFFIDKKMNTYNDMNFFYKPNNEEKRISIFEPNIDVVKYALYPILICEMLYNENKNLIDKLYVTNTDNIKNNPLFIDIMKHLNIVNDGIATFESRYNTPYFLGKYTDVVVSHQIYNPLNYAYLDALYLDYPLVHNAYMIKDAGYYYDGFDVETGKEMLKYALTEHDNNLEEHNEKNKKVLQRYLPTNEENIDNYRKLIKNAINK